MAKKSTNKKAEETQTITSADVGNLEDVTAESGNVVGSEVVAEIAEVVAETAKATASAKVEIVRGQMPAPIVVMIKREDTTLTDGALAAKYRTTNGKISDIRKEKNFGYLNVDIWVPTQAEIDKASAWAANHGGEMIIQEVAAMTAGSAEDRATFDTFKVEFRAAAKAASGGTPPVVEAVKGESDAAKSGPPIDGEDTAEIGSKGTAKTEDAVKKDLAELTE